MGVSFTFRRRLPARPVLALLRTCANGSNHRIFPLQLPIALLYVAVGTPAPKRVVGRLKERQKLEHVGAVSAALIRRDLSKQGAPNSPKIFFFFFFTPSRAPLRIVLTAP